MTPERRLVLVSAVAATAMLVLFLAFGLIEGSGR